MPREVVTIQVGQCGNQLGLRWWDVILQELRANLTNLEALSSVFYLNEEKGNKGSALDILFEPFSASGRPGRVGGSCKDSCGVRATLEDVDKALGARRLKARCVAIDTEEGVLKTMLKGPLNGLFDTELFVSDVSGAGNNWAVGHLEYGDRYVEEISAAVRALVERCDSLQAFVLLHSLSGGTGSGLGTRVLGALEDEYPAVFRFSSVVMASETDDVVVGPYNSCFALREHIEHSDCVIPIDNDALAAMAERSLAVPSSASACTNVGEPPSTMCTMRKGLTCEAVYQAARPTSGKSLPYATMNAIFAQMLSNLTCSIRYPGQLNMDISDITTNLVPYPRLHFLVSSLAPLYSTRASRVGSRHVDEMIFDCLNPHNQLLSCDIRQGTFLASAVLVRGADVNISDVSRNVVRLRKNIKSVYWNEECIRSAICSVPALGTPQSVLGLANNCRIALPFDALLDRFLRLYKAGSHLHHYTKYLEKSYFDDTVEQLTSLCDDYTYFETEKRPKEKISSIRDLLL